MKKRSFLILAAFLMLAIGGVYAAYTSSKAKVPVKTLFDDEVTYVYNATTGVWSQLVGAPPSCQGDRQFCSARIVRIDGDDIVVSDIQSIIAAATDPAPGAYGELPSAPGVPHDTSPVQVTINGVSYNVFIFEKPAA